MLELKLPIAMKYSKDGNDEFIYHTFTDKEEDVSAIVSLFRGAMEADMERRGEVVPE